MPISKALSCAGITLSSPAAPHWQCPHAVPLLCSLWLSATCYVCDVTCVPCDHHLPALLWEPVTSHQLLASSNFSQVVNKSTAVPGNLSHGTWDLGAGSRHLQSCPAGRTHGRRSNRVTLRAGCSQLAEQVAILLTCLSCHGRGRVVGGIRFGDAASSLGVGAHAPPMLNMTLLKIQKKSASKGQAECGCVRFCEQINKLEFKRICQSKTKLVADTYA